MAAKKHESNTDYFGDDFEVTFDEDLSDILELYNQQDKPPQRRDQNKKGRKRRLPNLLSPLKNAARTGGKAAASIVQKTLRAATLIVTVIIMAVIAVNFWKNHGIYGNPLTIAAERNYALGAYLGVGIFLLLFELAAFFRSLSSQRIRKGNRNYRLDVGRGLLPFIFICACSYLADIFGRLIPESPAILSGLKGGITLYGSLNSTLLVLATAGVISCILRRFLAR